MIWCVEDDASIRDIEVYTLSSTGFDARGFADGVSFWSALQTEKPDLVVLDVMLPGVDGIELSGLDMARRDGQKTPFFLDRLLAAWEGLTVPIFPVGGVFSRAAAEKVLAAGAPFVSLSRALICQPDFVERMEKGQTESPCLACNHCYNVYRQRPVRCVLHTEVIPQLEAVFGPYPT